MDDSDLFKMLIQCRNTSKHEIGGFYIGPAACFSEEPPSAPQVDADDPPVSGFMIEIEVGEKFKPA
jgi:hypothetical protein